MIRKFWLETGRDTVSAMVQMLVTIAFSADLLFLALLGFLISDIVESNGLVLAALTGAVLFAIVRGVARHIGPAA